MPEKKTTTYFTADGVILPDGTNVITVVKHTRPVVYDKAGRRQWGKEMMQEVNTTVLEDITPRDAARIIAALSDALVPHVIDNAPDEVL